MLAFCDLDCYLRYHYKKEYVGLFAVYTKTSDTIWIPRDFYRSDYKSNAVTITPLIIIGENCMVPLHYNILIADHKTRMVTCFEPVDRSRFRPVDRLLKRASRDQGYRYCCDYYYGPQYREMQQLGYPTTNCGYWILAYLDNSGNCRGGCHQYIVDYKAKIKEWLHDNCVYVKRDFYKTVEERKPLSYYVYT